MPLFWFTPFPSTLLVLAWFLTSGYVTAIDEKDGGLLVNVLISHRVLRTDTVYDMMVDIHNEVFTPNAHDAESEFKRRLKTQIIGAYRFCLAN